MHSLPVHQIKARPLLAIPLFWECHHAGETALFWELWFALTLTVYFLTICYFTFSSLPARQRHLGGILTREFGGNFPPPAYEFCSRATLLGLPLLHIRLGDRFDVVRGPVKAWLAIGSSHAVGVIFASGGIAVAPVAFGGIAIGVFSFGALALGIFSIGALAFGGWCFGAFAVGWQIFCGGGVALNAGEGGLILARDFALGGLAHAAQANTEAAKQFIYHGLFFRTAYAISRHGLLVQLAWIIPMFLQAWLVMRAKCQREQSNV